MVKNIIVFGAGGHAKTVIDTLEKQGLYRIAGLLDGGKPAGSVIYGYEVLGNEEWLADRAGEIEGAIVAIGDNWRRSQVADAIRSLAPDLPFVSAIHPAAHIARGARIGAGSVIMAGAVLGSDAELGEHGIMYPGASIDHDCRIGRFVSWAPRSVSGGNVTVGDFSAIAIGAVLIHSVTVGEHCVVGAGSTVIRSIPSNTVAFGTPAKPVREREHGERYL
ncbi:acetyltransferase [Paenibacillus soyae]|uniref:Acetyltransferase n=1 Tax=Paenibacillus soyae TaxID=2969249 RepID=A0A9X2S9A1_9BACL|nr:acetyltransferase [Paenibacillus soyae]MCR2802507.1 acetyltransferase [Paenibacillus soyae]